LEGAGPWFASLEHDASIPKLKHATDKYLNVFIIK